MPVQDRTIEFRTCVESIRNRTLGPNRSRQVTKPGSSKSEFARMAGSIGKDIASCSLKLDKLRKTLFDDKPVEISELTYVIKQEIASINKQIATLQAYVKSQNQQGRGKNSREVEEHNNNVVMLLQSKLANTSMSFKDVLEIRTQESKDRTDKFVYSASQAATNAPPPASSLLFADPAERSKSKGKGKARDTDLLALDIDRSERAEAGEMGGDGYMQMQLVERQDNYLQERSTAIESIESTIAELGQIFTQLAQMVAEQRETVQRIDADTVDIANNVAGAQRELLKYYASISSNRWLMLKVFGVLIVFVSTLLRPDDAGMDMAFLALHEHGWWFLPDGRYLRPWALSTISSRLDLACPCWE
ncbi:SNARE protein SED5/Syntaxin 5 [Rhizoctonia solani AG-1 IA]|uniref:SNARE protein SED5/Syntaxin 5 n=1 Tax=Thanatephorus cucumeris (strain AG1-IA) TaxID=983506 RepID=L8WR01_THACA|nr:SNARE protein SED5/Syntaxin 5 [Rhizoctonia solani AG-1 IA]